MMWLLCRTLVLPYCLCALALVLGAPDALAHKPSDSYLALSTSGAEVIAQWDIALRDLDHAIGLDTDDDGAITWDEVRGRKADIAAYALARLTVSSAGERCVSQPPDLLIDRHSDGAYAVLRFDAPCGRELRDLAVDYRLFFDLDPQHRGLMRFTSGGVVRTAIFSPERPTQRFDAAGASRLEQFVAFAREGVWHIAIGIDHLLFLLALLLPAVLVRTADGWRPVTDLSSALWNAFKIVTAFTIAHSITLSLAALQVVSLPSRWVETAIAASVLLAALNNIYPVVRRRLWLVAFVFGLIHGFGFASVLTDLGLPRDSLLLSLLGFNLGVELGQLAIVALYFLLAYAMRSRRLYQGAVLSGGSALIALVALGWMLERGLDLKLLPF